MKGPIVVAAGGTGGHLIPALAVVEELRRRDPELSVAFVGTRRAMDDELVRRSGYRAYTTSVRPFRRDLSGLFAPASLLPATFQARATLRRERAAIALGMGGYPSLPVIAAARLDGVPALIHEANAVPGLANEIAGRLTPNVAVSFPAAMPRFRRPRLVGVPVRRELARFDRESLRKEALAVLGLEPDRRTVLVFGGSLGAARLNRSALAVAQRWSDRDDLQLVLATGREHAAAAEAEVPPARLVVRVHPFIERMELAYAVADVVVSRAGASTVAELAATGTPAVLVPLPIARRREQHANAAALADAGGALVVEDEAATAGRLAPLLEEMLGDPDRLPAMAAAARSVGRPEAAAEMADWILELAA